MDRFVFNSSHWTERMKRTFLMSVSLLTLMSMLTGVWGNASKTSLRRGMRVSSLPSQKNSADKSTAALVPTQTHKPSRTQKGIKCKRHCPLLTNMMYSGQKYLSERLHPACTDMKGAPAESTKQSAIVTQGTRSADQMISGTTFSEVPQKKPKKYLSSFHTLYIYRVDCATPDQLTLIQAKICG